MRFISELRLAHLKEFPVRKMSHIVLELLGFLKRVLLLCGREGLGGGAGDTSRHLRPRGSGGSMMLSIQRPFPFPPSPLPPSPLHPPPSPLSPSPSGHGCSSLTQFLLETTHSALPGNALYQGSVMSQVPGLVPVLLLDFVAPVSGKFGIHACSKCLLTGQAWLSKEQHALFQLHAGDWRTNLRQHPSLTCLTCLACLACLIATWVA